MSPRKEKSIPRINQAFAKLVNDNGSQTQAAELLDFRSQDIGYYIRGRAIPSELIAACRKKYGYDLLELAETDFENIVLKKKDSFETNVSRETNIDKIKVIPPDDWREIWHELKINNQQFRKTREDDVREKDKILTQNSQLLEIFVELTRRGII